MKKLFFAIVALAFVATSCSKDEAPEANQAVGATKTVTFAVNTPVMQTRIIRQDGMGFSIDKLYYAFYEKVGDTYVRVDGISSVSNTGVLTPISFSNYSSVELKPTLVVGKTYKAIFWAQSSKAPYTVSMPAALENAVVNMNYYDPKLIYEEYCDNTEKYDAFYKMLDIVVTERYEGEDVLLYRPFAQLNLAVSKTDEEDGRKAGVDVKSVRLSVEKVHNAFNLATGEATGEQDVVFPWHASGVPGMSRISKEDNKYYNYSVHYILLGAAENSTPKELTNVTFEMSEIADSASACDADPDKIVRSYENVPVQSNYRTYIAGDVVTGGATYNYTVNIDPNFANEGDPTIHPAQ